MFHCPIFHFVFNFRRLLKQGKMFQYVGILLAVLGLGRAQTLPTLPYFQNLDGDGDFVINWGLTNDSITIELIVYTTGWVGLGLLSDDSTMIDYWWGGFDEDFGIDYIQVTSRSIIHYYARNIVIWNVPVQWFQCRPVDGSVGT